MTARKLIEEAREILLQSPTFSFDPMTRASEKLVEALSLLPEWQEFDINKKETWPPEDDNYPYYLVTVENRVCIYAWLNGTGWAHVTAYQRLMSPCIKP